MGKKRMETLLLIIFAAGIGILQDNNKPIQYELEMEDGSQVQVALQKNSSYACPIYCNTDHIHQAVICKDEIQLANNQSLYHISKSRKNNFGIYCSTKKILSMSKLSPKTTDEKLPDVVSASTEK